MQGSIAISGGGIAGLTTAIALQQIGLNPVIFEAAPVIREIGAGIGLGANAFKALHYLGIDKEVIEAGRDLSTFIIYNEKGKVLSKTRLTEHVYEYDSDKDSNVIEVYVNRLRQKIGEDFIQTRRGQGYVFNPPVQT